MIKKNVYIIRLDDASSRMDVKKWNKIEKILDKYNIKPIVGIIANNLDSDLQKYEEDKNFVDTIKNWNKKKWYIAMHGYNHIFCSNESGINPINNKSEFAGLSLEEQRKKIKNAYNFFKQINIIPTIFFAPAHTFDLNTIEALRLETNIRIISDTIANDIYFKDGFYFIPQQSGKVRKLPLKLVTFCYHPNVMKDKDFEELEKFISNNLENFKKIKLKKRKKSLYDRLLSNIYFKIRKIKKII